MKVPYKLEVMKRLQAHLNGIDPSAINTATGEPFTMSVKDRVFLGRRVLGQEVVMPALALLEAPKPPEPNRAGHNGEAAKDAWDILVQGFADKDEINPLAPAYELEAAVMARLFMIVEMDDQGRPKYKELHRLGNLIIGMTVSSGVVSPAKADVSPTAFFYLPIRVIMSFNTNQPYVDAV